MSLETEEESLSSNFIKATLVAHCIRVSASTEFLGEREHDFEYAEKDLVYFPGLKISIFRK